MRFCQVILPLSLPNSFTYSIPDKWLKQLHIGCRVEVEFGKRKRYSALVIELHNIPPEKYTAKPVISLIDKQPIVTKRQLDFWHWIADYYMCNIGDVMAAALPAGLRLTSETIIQLKEGVEFDLKTLTDDEYIIFEALSHQNELKTGDVQAILSRSYVYPIINSLLAKNVVSVKEQLKGGYKEKTIPYIKLKDSYAGDEAMQKLLDQLNRAPKQQELMLAYIDLSRNGTIWIEKKQLLARGRVDVSVAKRLVDKGIFLEEHKNVGRLKGEDGDELFAKLSVAQTKALSEVKKSFEQTDVCLLHGVTSSGKTHIYIRLIEEYIKQGKQVLYLLPEIALTGQIIRRLQKHFGKKVGIYHSKFNNAERVEIWNKTLQDEYKIIVGARSAVFLPFIELGLVIVDEEHDQSFKQYDPAPRYNGRDAAVYLAAKSNAKVLLGSATPSFESYYNAEHGRYELVELNERFGGIKMPDIEFVNLLRQNIPGKKYMKFSLKLVNAIKDALKNEKQIILFQNRRGYSSFLQCFTCNHSPRCINCDVSLTYHKFRHNLQCHYCGYSQKQPIRCEVCGSEKLGYIGLGTQRIEEDLAVFVPEARVGRMDWDTTRTKKGHQKIIDKFERHEFDILVGTQMVTKGLDFDNVSLVGIMDADSLINFPDFRSVERAFQLMEQVSGRAGRKEKQGKVLIQIRNDQHESLPFVKSHNYKGFYKAAINERKNWMYPPFYRQIKLVLKHKTLKTVQSAAYRLANDLKVALGTRVKGPSEPLIARVQTYYLREILITLERDKDKITKAKHIIRRKIDGLKSLDGLKQIRVNIDVDAL